MILVSTGIFSFKLPTTALSGMYCIKLLSNTRFLISFMAATAKGELLLMLTHASVEEVIVVTHRIATTYPSGKIHIPAKKELRLSPSFL